MLQKNASDYNIPLFVSETGCRIPKPRLFDDQAAILGNKMSDTWSGTIVYEWITEENDYGLISYGNFHRPFSNIFANRGIRPQGGPGQSYRCTGRVPQIGHPNPGSTGLQQFEKTLGNFKSIWSQEFGLHRD